MFSKNQIKITESRPAHHRRAPSEDSAAAQLVRALLPAPEQWVLVDELARDPYMYDISFFLRKVMCDVSWVLGDG